MKELSKYLDEVERREKIAYTEVNALCLDPASRRMSIPTQPTDSDMKISAALRDNDRMIRMLRVATKALDEIGCTCILPCDCIEDAEETAKRARQTLDAMSREVSESQEAE